MFLFDEPLSNLDAALRINTRVEIAKLHKFLKATIIYVTHDQVEAMTLADKIVVMNAGRIEQTGKPLDLYYRPANLFVAGFIGSPAMNFIAGTATAGGGVDLGSAGTIPPGRVSAAQAGDKVTLGIRPEHMTLGGKSGPPLAATVDLIERLGESGFAHLRLPSGDMIISEIRGEPGYGIGDSVNVGLDPAHIHLFGAGGNRLV